jgi:hypothetical protein
MKEGLGIDISKLTIDAALHHAGKRVLMAALTYNLKKYMKRPWKNRKVISLSMEIPQIDLAQGLLAFFDLAGNLIDIQKRALATFWPPIPKTGKPSENPNGQHKNRNQAGFKGVAHQSQVLWCRCFCHSIKIYFLRHLNERFSVNL